MPHVLPEKEKKLMFENMPVRYIFHISIVKKLFHTAHTIRKLNITFALKFPPWRSACVWDCTLQKSTCWKSCEIQFQAHFVNGGKRRFFHYEKKVRNFGHEFAKINLRNMIFVVSNLGPFSVSVFLSGKNLPTKIPLRKHSIYAIIIAFRGQK